MYVLWRLIVKELLQLRQDRRMIPLIVVAPVVQLVLFGFAVNTDVAHVPMVLVDQDRSRASRDLVDRFVQSGYFDVVGFEDSPEDVDRWLIGSRAQVALVIAHGYMQSSARGGTSRVQLIADGSDASPATVALGYGSAIITRAAAARQLEAIGRLDREVGFPPPAGRTELVPRVLYNPDLRSRWFYIPAVLAMILTITTTLLSAMAVVREKEIGTMEQIMVTPIRAWQLIAGKLLPFVLIGVVQVLLVTAVAVFGFGVPLRGSFLLLLFLTQLFVLNALGLGLLVSTLVRTQQQAMMLAAFTINLPMLYLSGLIFPIENMPPLIQNLTYLIPLRYYANILRGIFLRGSGLGVLWPEAVALTVMGMAILTLASLRFRKRLD